jgi:GNAT superfamily N-acetyltransferase
VRSIRVAPSAVLLRAANREERDAIIRLMFVAYEEFEPFLTPENWALMMTNISRVVQEAREGDLLVAEIGGGIGGSVTYYPPGPKDYTRVPPEWAVIRILAVHPAWRRRGVARMLTDECLRRAREDQAPFVGLHTSELMHAARTMYEQFGFRRQRDFTHLGVGFTIYALAMQPSVPTLGAHAAAPEADRP